MKDHIQLIRQRLSHNSVKAYAGDNADWYYGYLEFGVA